MTAEGLAELQTEVERLEGTERKEIAQQIKTAREWGDLKENAEYHAAKESQAHLETKILLLRDKISNAEVVEVEAGDVVAFGSTVALRDEETGQELTYTLVAAHDAALAEGKLSYESPVADALRGLQAGETAVVKTPRGERRLSVITVG
ncbi:MAG: transcription elongation factor GreA [Thermoleophilaceae bacterium]|nr:transcription elongation factor GreA [Thermoleophilaceae bacterium]